MIKETLIKTNLEILRLSKTYLKKFKILKLSKKLSKSHRLI